MSRPSALRWLALATHIPGDGRGGGIVRWTNEFVRAMALRDDVELHVAAARGASEFFVDELGVCSTRVFETVGGLRGELAIRHGSVLRHTAPVDVVQGFKHLVPARCEATRVLTVHDMTLLDRPRDFGRLKRHLLPRPYVASIGDAEHLACVSEATRQQLLRHVPSARQRAFVARVGVAESLLNATARPIDTMIGRRFALAVGDGSPRKNLKLLVDLWPAVRSRVPDAVLLLVGPRNWGQNTTGEALQRLVSEGSVVCAGHVGDGELRWAYENCRALIFPSFSEGYGMPVSEAIAFGAHVVRSADPAAAEAARGRGDVVSLDDAEGWIAAIADSFASQKRIPPVATRWSETVEDIVASVSRHRQAPTKAKVTA